MSIGQVESRHGTRGSVLPPWLATPCVVVDDGGVIYEGNQAAGKLLGYDVGWFQNRHVSALTLDKEGANLSTHLHEQTAFKVDGLCRNGEVLPLLVLPQQQIGSSNGSLQPLFLIEDELDPLKLDRGPLARKGRVAAIMPLVSHEISTPLMILQELVALLKDGYCDIADVGKATQKLCCVLEELRDVCALEEGRLNLDMVDFGLSDCLPECYSSHTHLSFDVQKDASRLRGDLKRVKRTLFTLTQQIERLFEGAGAIHLQVAMPSLSGGVACVEFSFQVKGAKALRPWKELDGSDIVLAAQNEHYCDGQLSQWVAAQFIAACKGRVRAETMDANRLTVTLALPFSVAAPTTASPPHSPTLWKSANVLVVDDNKSTCAILQRMLRDLGLGASQVQTSENGEQALAWVARASYQLVVLDYQMDPLDGLEVARRVRAYNPAIRLVICSAYPNVALFEAAIQDGRIDGFLPKPLNRQAFHLLCSQLLHAGHAAQGVADASRQ